MAEEKENDESAVEGQGDDGGGSRFIPGERREEVVAPRRASEERRQAPESAPDSAPDMDDKPQRQDPARRTQEERRSTTFDVVCKTSGSLNSIEDWLDDNCQGDWELVLLNLGEDMSQKSIKVIFSLHPDKDQFIKNYGVNE